LSLSNNQITGVVRDRLKKEEKRLYFFQVYQGYSDSNSDECACYYESDEY